MSFYKILRLKCASCTKSMFFHRMNGFWDWVAHYETQLKWSALSEPYFDIRQQRNLVLDWRSQYLVALPYWWACYEVGRDEWSFNNQRVVVRLMATIVSSFIFWYAKREWFVSEGYSFCQMIWVIGMYAGNCSATKR